MAKIDIDSYLVGLSYDERLAEERFLEEVKAGIPGDVDNEDDRVQEQWVQRLEQRAAAEAGDGAEPGFESELDGARFFTEAALAAHDAAFYPAPPKRSKKAVQQVPVVDVTHEEPPAPDTATEEESHEAATEPATE